MTHLTDRRVYWLWAQEVFGPGSPMPAKLNAYFSGGLQELWEGGPVLWARLRPLKEAEMDSMRSFTPEDARARLEYAERLGWQVITPESGEYPPQLRNIPDPPAVLYGKGTVPDWDQTLPLAVVGSRKALPVWKRPRPISDIRSRPGGACW